MITNVNIHGIGTVPLQPTRNAGDVASPAVSAALFNNPTEKLHPVRASLDQTPSSDVAGAASRVFAALFDVEPV